MLTHHPHARGALTSHRATPRHVGSLVHTQPVLFSTQLVLMSGPGACATGPVAAAGGRCVGEKAVIGRRAGVARQGVVHSHSHHLVSFMSAHHIAAWQAPHPTPNNRVEQNLHN